MPRATQAFREKVAFGTSTLFVCSRSESIGRHNQRRERMREVLELRMQRRVVASADFVL